MPYPEIWLNELAKRGVLSHVCILVGVPPLKSLKMATYMHNEVPGVQIPEPCSAGCNLPMVVVMCSRKACKLRGNGSKASAGWGQGVRGALDVSCEARAIV